jgi:2-amino-4-hydroxy-6-hydroxymethyldihydropteridine diphosphokinase
VKRAIIALGSNVAERKENLQASLQRLSFSSRIISISDIYETFGMHEKRSPYLNCCLEVETDMTSQQLMLFLQEAQRQIIETSSDKGEFRVALDCDLISFENEIIRTPQLTLPHPEAHRRAFVMIPLAQINPKWLHPLLQKTAEELAKQAYWACWGTFFANGKSLLDF